LGTVLYALGEMVLARTHYEQALALYDPQQRQEGVVPSEADRRATGLSIHSNVLWLLGYPDQALAQSRTALSLAQERAHPFTTAVVWIRNVMFHKFLREARTVQQRAEDLTALCNEQGYSAFLEGAIVWCGWALAKQGQAEEGIQQIQQGIAIARAIGMELFRPQFLALLAEVYGKTRQVEEGLTALAEALTLVEKNGERTYEAELYRLKGKLTLQKGARDWELGAGASSLQAPSLKPLVPSGAVEEAEEYFLKAVEIAQKQQTKSWELRATVSLARLWQRQGRQAEAHNLLSEIYTWFTEGFDTKDLQEAKALLDELAEGG